MSGTPSPVLSPEEFDFLLAELRRSGDELLGGVPVPGSPLWRKSDGDGRWTVAEIVEHLVIVETLVQQNLPGQVAEGPRPGWEAVEVTPMEVLRQVRVRGERRVEAPPRLHPGGSVEAGALPARFRSARAATIAWAGGLRDQPLRAILPPPHPALGQLNAAQRLLSVAWHTDRHVEQIRECLR